MSLINDALKRAQKQRTGDSPPLAAMPGVGGEPAARIAKRAKPVGFNALIIRIGLGAGTLLVLVVGGYFAVRARHDQPGPPPPPASAAPVAESTPQPAAEPAFVLPVTPAPEAVAKPEVSAPLESKPAATPAVVTPPPPPPAPAKPTAKLDPRAIAFIDNLRIAGIRASATDSKVLMNDRVYRVGDIVEHDLGLKLTGITSSSLTFEDPEGATHTRQF